MLGKIESERVWRWTAFGKHPAARDYFRVGQEFPLVMGFSDWMENGFQMLISKKDGPSGPYSWRFWARGSERESFACGVVRDSSDRMGRSFPLLIMGTGPLDHWGDHWDLLPFACEKTWDQMEYLSAQMFSEFKLFESEIYKLRPPRPEWSEWKIRRGDLKEWGSISHANERTQDLDGLKKQALRLTQETEVLVGLDQGGSNDQFAWTSFWHLLFKNEAKVVPNAFFIGGTLERAYLAVFRRPLGPSDFVQLWSVSH